MKDTLNSLRSPYPWFGGKSKVASEVWKRFGVVKNYVEPFFGSGAVLLRRPQPFEGTETINDMDGFVCNFWRAVQSEPDAVANFVDWPVNELDLHARHKWLMSTARAQVERLRDDPDFYDVKVAGWWVWGLCQWIGRGWCSGSECKQLPHLGDAGIGVHRSDYTGDDLYRYFDLLSKRLRRVRVCCGDWSRVCGQTPTVKQGLTAVFLDPPYSQEERDPEIYSVESDVGEEVRQWCADNGECMRIALCGYEGEHNDLEQHGWDMWKWKATGGYSSGDNENSSRERIWFSPLCVKDQGLFD